MRKLFLFSLILFAASLLASGEDNKLNILIKINELGEGVELTITFTNDTHKKQYLDEGGIGITDFRNLEDRFIVLDKNGEELMYRGIRGHVSDVVHVLKPGESLVVTHDISRVYDFEKVETPATIQYKDEYHDKDFNTIILQSNTVVYSGPPIKFRPRW